MANIDTTLGELISVFYEEFMEIYGDEDIASVAAAAVIRIAGDGHAPAAAIGLIGRTRRGVGPARTAVAASEVLDGVPELIGTVKIECLFGDGMRVLHVERPIGPAAPPRAGGA